MRRAAAGSLAGASHTFITPSCGASQPSQRPSGLICPPARVGLPNSASRGISGTSWIRSAAVGKLGIRQSLAVLGMYYTMSDAGQAGVPLIWSRAVPRARAVPTLSRPELLQRRASVRRIIAPVRPGAQRDTIPFSRFPRSKHFMIRLFSALAATTILCGCVAQPTPIASAPATADTASQPQAAAHTPAGQPKYGTYGFDTAGMDRNVAPGDNFYQFANGTWAQTTPIPA